MSLTVTCRVCQAATGLRRLRSAERTEGSRLAVTGADSPPGRGTNAAAALAFALAAIAAATVALAIADAALAPAVLVYLAVLAMVAHRPLPAVVAVVASCAAVNLWFTEPVGTFEITKSEDLVPLIAFSVAAFTVVRFGSSREPGALLALAAVAATAAALLLTDADLVIASTVFTGLVVVIALLGVPAGVFAVLGSYVALNFWFTPPYESLEINKFEDLVPLIVFGAVAAVSAGTVSRINWLRQRQVEIEREVFEARVSSAVNESRAAFLSSMTHNLRTPLASIKAAVSRLAGSSAIAPASDEADLIAIAHDETDRLERLVTKVLELSRIHAGALQPSAEPTDVGELAGIAVRRLRHLAGDRRMRLSVGEDAVLIVTVDPAMIELVLVTLLENALRYAPDGSVIDVRAEATEDGVCELRVVDHGPGIPDADVERVFEEFVRLDTHGQGSGLGLAIARALVTAHGGRTWVEQTPGGGATLAFSLPGVEVT